MQKVLERQPENRIKEIASELPDVSRLGLSESEARRRLKVFGYNEPAKKPKRAMALEILSRFANPLVILLLAIGVLSFFFADKFSAAIIFVMAVMSVLLSFIQEHRAEKAAEELNAMVHTTAAVYRNGKIVELRIREIVPGDVVSLSAGDMVPADIGLLTCKDLFINQSSLTGESFPVEKYAAAIPSGQPLLSQPANMVYMGTSVLSGTAVGLVEFTGEKTEFGKISGKLLGAKPQTNFDKGINDFTWLMIRAILAMVVIILVINIFTKNNFLEAFLFALAVAVGLTPETLPMIVTINLSKGARDLAKRKVIVKRLDSIQNFGAMDILCTDKTGTLTLDEVVLEKYCNVLGEDSEDVFKYGYINSFYQTGLKNLLDRAVLKYEHLQLKGFKKIDEIPFDFQRRIMSVAVSMEGKEVLIAKGAPEEILKRCSHFELNGEIKPITEKHIPEMQLEFDKLSSEGFRVLSVAFKEFEKKTSAFTAADEAGMVLKGFMAFLDPAKPTAKETIERLEKVGVKLKVLTGDNELVTRKICGDIGMDIEGFMTGDQVETLNDTELAVAVETTTVFARLLPLQKERVIRLLHNNNHTVGYLGDGINDAPALKAADVGISVNNAVDVAKESASIILLKKSLVVLADGVVEGRKVFGNINKYIRMSSSSNFGNMLSMTGASIFLPFLPMAPVQILLNNFFYDLAQIGIPTDEVDKEYLEKPKPWNISLIKKFMVIVGPVSSVFDFLTYAVMWWVFKAYNNQELFHTGWFLESLLTQTVVVYIIRTKKIPFLQSRPSKLLVLTSSLVLAIGFILPFSPLASAFGFVRPPLMYFVILSGILFAYLFLVQLVKNWFIRRFEKE